MLKSSIAGRRTTLAIIGWIVGVVTGLLVVAPAFQQVRTSFSEHSPTPEQSVAFEFQRAESGSQTFLEALPALCGKKSNAPSGGNRETDKRHGVVWQQAHAGIDNATRLLPLARRLTLQALREAGVANGKVPGTRGINAVRRIVLDSQLGSMAEVREERPTEIRVGPNYAMHLTSDDDVMLLLGHELTHVASWSGKLRGFIHRLSAKARFKPDGTPNWSQKEDLACDFIGVLVLKRFIDLNPTNESKAERLSRVLGYESHSERLRYAWDDFCDSYYGDFSDAGDDEHLNGRDMLRALRGLDPELEALIPVVPTRPTR